MSFCLFNLDDNHGEECFTNPWHNASSATNKAILVWQLIKDAGS